MRYHLKRDVRWKFKNTISNVRMMIVWFILFFIFFLYYYFSFGFVEIYYVCVPKGWKENFFFSLLLPLRFVYIVLQESTAPSLRILRRFYLRVTFLKYFVLFSFHCCCCLLSKNIVWFLLNISCVPDWKESQLLLFSFYFKEQNFTLVLYLFIYSSRSLKYYIYTPYFIIITLIK